MKRLCDVCGKPITFGCMTDDGGNFYAHEECFETYMDKTYGKHKWMSLGNGEQDEFGGFYICTADVVGGYEGTGIYYTEEVNMGENQIPGKVYVLFELIEDDVELIGVYTSIEVLENHIAYGVDYVEKGIFYSAIQYHTYTIYDGNKEVHKYLCYENDVTDAPTYQESYLGEIRITDYRKAGKK